MTIYIFPKLNLFLTNIWMVVNYFFIYFQFIYFLGYLEGKGIYYFLLKLTQI